MNKEIIISTDKSVYLDTSFIINAFYDSYSKDKEVVENSQEVLWLLYQYKVWGCYISNITINELFNTIEKQWYRAFIDLKIIKKLWITEIEWKELGKSEKEKYRADNDSKLGFNYYDIKSWRKNDYKEDYKIYVYNEFENIVTWIKHLDIKIITNLNMPHEYDIIFFKNIKIYNKLDSNDLNHFLLCKENNISWIITCDSDFTQLKNDLEIVHIDKKFKLY